jgi:hypothetical protein
VLNLEMCERPAGFVVYAGKLLLPLLRRIVLQQRDLGLSAGVREILDLYSDHMPFLLAGIPSFTLAYRRSEDARQRVHTVHDRLDAIDPEGLAGCADLAATALLALADSSSLLPARLDEEALRAYFQRQGRDLDLVRARGY